jgi:hypothetical protein
MSDRALIAAAFIIGGAIITASYQTRARYSLSAAEGNIVWRMDTWSGQIDICAAAPTDKGPLVSCGAFVVGNPLVTNPAAPPGGGGTQQPRSAEPGSEGNPETQAL